MFEGPPFDLALSYANVVRNVWLAAFFAPVFPFGPFFVTIGFIAYYWSKKVFFKYILVSNHLIKLIILVYTT